MKKTLLLTSITLSLFVGCADKNSGSRYSYDPYTKKSIQTYSSDSNSFQSMPISSAKTVKYEYVYPGDHLPPVVQQPQPFHQSYIPPVPQQPRVIHQTAPQAVPQAPIKPRKRIFDYSSKANHIASDALAMMGVPYLYGANGPRKYDCSSFVKYIYSKNGINLPRTAAEQARKGSEVGKYSLAKGDLVFFKSKNKAIGHVGIYLGSTKFIHCSSSKGKVVVSSLKERYYRRNFLYGKKIS